MHVLFFIYSMTNYLHSGDFFLGFRLMKVWGGLDDLEVKGTIRIHVFIR